MTAVNAAHTKNVEEAMNGNRDFDSLNRQEQIAFHYEEIMGLLGIKETEDNKDTPVRVAKSLMEMTENTNSGLVQLKEACTVFDNNSMGVKLEMDDIEFTSLCSHHHLPFFGKVRIEYMPRDQIVGLSKFARIVEFFAKKPQVQEDFTREVAEFLAVNLDPIYVRVTVYDTVHTCMCSRGVRSKANTKTQITIGHYDGRL